MQHPPAIYFALRNFGADQWPIWAKPPRFSNFQQQIIEHFGAITAGLAEGQRRCTAAAAAAPGGRAAFAKPSCRKPCRKANPTIADLLSVRLMRLKKAGVQSIVVPESSDDVVQASTSTAFKASSGSRRMPMLSALSRVYGFGPGHLRLRAACEQTAGRGAGELNLSHSIKTSADFWGGWWFGCANQIHRVTRLGRSQPNLAG